MFSKRLPAVVCLLPVLSLAAAGRSQGQPAPPTDGLPLKTTRTVKFTTNEGTWMSLDVSPDGRTVVFDLLGDVYTLPIAGGAAQRITDGPAFDAQPRYSPDGKSIVFTSDRTGAGNVWVMDADGRNPRAVTTTITFSLGGDYISPEWIDDNTIAVSRSPNLMLYDLRGGKGFTVTGPTTPPSNHMGVALGGNPRYWYVSVDAGANSGLTGGMASRGIGNWQVHRYDRDIGTTSALTNNVGGGIRPVVSPNGRYLVYATRRDAVTALKLRDLESGTERWFVGEVQRDAQERGSTRDLMPGSSFTPDSAALITSYQGRIWRVPVPDGVATKIPFTAEVEQQLGPFTRFDYRIDDGPVKVRQIRDPRVSPDGRRVAFNALRQIWIVERSGGTPRRLSPADQSAYSPSWSPDGQSLVYVTWNDTEGGHVYRVRSDGTGQPERLTRHPAVYNNVVYTPDGQRLALIRAPILWRLQKETEFGNSQRVELDLAWMPAAGGDLTRVTSMPLAPGTSEYPTRFPAPHFVRGTSDRVYIHEVAEGLVSMRLDGTDRRTIFKAQNLASPFPQMVAREMLISPDGSRVLISALQSILVAVVPPVPGRPALIAVDNPNDAPVPVVRASRFGAEFPSWSADSRSVHYAIGQTVFTHDLAAERAAQSAKGPDARPYEPERLDVKLTMPRDRPEGTVVLRGARVLMERSKAAPVAAQDGQPPPAPAPFDVVEKADIVVTGNRIAAVGPSGRVRVPAGARVIDVAGKTIIPGLIDIHAHPRPPTTIHSSTQSFDYLANLAYGVTTMRDPYTKGFDFVTYGDLIDAGLMIGPRVMGTGPGVEPHAGIKSLKDAREVVKRYAEYPTETIKEYVAGNRRIRQWIVMAARELKLSPGAEAGGNLPHNLTFILDGYPNLEHSFPIVPLFKDVVELTARSGVVYTPTLTVNYGGPQGENYYLQRTDIHEDTKLRRFIPHDELDAMTLRRRQFFREDQFIFRDHALQAAKILAAGGRVALGAHGQMQGLGAHWELWSLASGMSNADAIRAATIMGAEGIGHGQDLGSIAPGKLADLLVLDRNPLEDIRNSTSIRYVMKNGRIYEGDTLNEIWPRQRELAPPAWRTFEAMPPKGRTAK